MMKRSDTGGAAPLLAWAGWWLPLPADWRLFHIHGSYSQGSLILGDQERPRLENSWAWVTRRSFRAEKYSRRFLLAHLPRRKRTRASHEIQTLSLPGFSYAALLVDESKTFAVGYAAETSRLLHWVYHHGTDEEDTRFLNESLPAWRDQPLNAGVRWRFFDISFASPPGFRLRYGTLGLGDMEVLLVDPSRWRTRRHLCIRHLYPAELALSRQPAQAWLRGLFRKRRGPYRATWKHRKETESDPASHSDRLEARLQFMVRFIFRLLVFRMPACAEASLHHLEARDKLLYLQIAGPKDAITEIRESVIRSLPPA